MTTQVEPASPEARAAYSISVWEFIPPLLWAGIGLLLLTGWIWFRGTTHAGADDLDLVAPFVIGPGILAIAALALFALAVLRKSKTKGDVAKLLELEGQLRQWLWLLAVVGGGVLLALAAWFFLSQRQKHVIPEVSSLAVMGLISLGASLALKHTPQSALSQQGILQKLVGIRQQLGIGLIVIGIGLCGWGVFYVYKASRSSFGDFPGLPEGVGLVLLGLVFLGCGLYTVLTLDRPATSEYMRLLSLYIGSLSGFIITLATAMRVWYWRSYLTTYRNWQGEESWRFWVCMYIALFGLVLTLGSLLLARVDVRVNASARRVLYGYNAGFTGVLLAILLVIVNIMISVSFASNVQWNPKMGMQSISSTTRTTLEGLKERVTIYVLMGRGSATYLDVRDLLDNCQSVTDKLTVVEVSPDLKDVEYRKLAQKYPDLGDRTSIGPGGKGQSGRGILIAYGEAPVNKRLPHEFISEQDLEEQGPSGRRKFLGEKLLVQKILQLADKGAVKTKIYFTQNSGELWIDDTDLKRPLSDRLLSLSRFGGAGELVSMLRKDNFEVQGLVWEAKPQIPVPEIFSFSKASAKDRHEVPDDCTILMIANPERAFPKDVLEAIDRYMDKRNGKLMILSNAGVLRNRKFTDDGLIELCKKYNVELNKDFVLRLNPREEVVVSKATVAPESTNKVAREFTKNRFMFILPRTMSAMKNPAANYKVEPLLQITKEVNGPVGAETDTVALADDPEDYVFKLMSRGQLASKVSNEPLTVGVTVTDREEKPRAVILGNYTFVCTFELVNSPDAPTNYDFVRSCLAWLSERPGVVIGISPKESDLYEPQEASKLRLVALPMGLMVLLLGGLGTGIWIVRRR